MSLTFPNPSRSYDDALDRIRFIGHDGMFQIAFFVEIDALAKTTKNLVRTEAGYLEAFDAARSAIERVALKAYSRDRNSMIVLRAADMH
ncbi:MAG: DUF1488 domain-containing protein [Rhizobiaceae bacterium]|nr:DUF1488 domain-containing protein [Rhizobiaceae bacterium]